MTIEQQLAEIEAYCEKATEGPWHTITLTGVFDGDPLLILSETVEDAVVASIGADLPEEQANGTFIARARTDLPALCKLVRELLQREPDPMQLIPFTYHDGLREALRLITQNGNLRDAVEEIKEELARPAPKGFRHSVEWVNSRPLPTPPRTGD